LKLQEFEQNKYQSDVLSIEIAAVYKSQEQSLIITKIQLN